MREQRGVLLFSLHRRWALNKGGPSFSGTSYLIGLRYCGRVEVAPFSTSYPKWGLCALVPSSRPYAGSMPTEREIPGVKICRRLYLPHHREPRIQKHTVMLQLTPSH